MDATEQETPMSEVGTRGAAEAVVTEKRTARAVGSGGLAVYATPALAALVERAAWDSVEDALAPGETTVGTRLELDHLAPTPPGATVRAETELELVEGRRLRFRFEAFDGAGRIARGVHERVVVDAGRFMARASSRQS